MKRWLVCGDCGQGFKLVEVHEGAVCPFCREMMLVELSRGQYTELLGDDWIMTGNQDGFELMPIEAPPVAVPEELAEAWQGEDDE